VGGDAPADTVAPVRALAAAAVAVFLLPTASASAQRAPIEVLTSIPSPAAFGKPFSARIVVVMDRDAVEARSLRVTSALAPLTQLAATRVSRSSRGGDEVVTFDVMAACLEQRCVPARGAERRLRLPAVRASARTRDGETLSVSEPWRPLTIRGRVRASDLARSPLPFKTDLEAPAVTYRVAPSTLTAVLAALAIGLALAALALAARQVARVVRQRKLVELSELERALVLARSSGSRSPEDRRRALGLLARVLRSRQQRLAAPTSTLAWSAPLPSPGSVSTLVEQVEKEVGA
jgi:hypothetical protein